MKILNLRPSGEGGAVATFDIDIAPGLRLTTWQLRKTPSGEWRTFPPSPRNGTPAAITSPELRDQITRSASEIYTKGAAAHGDASIQ